MTKSKIRREPARMSSFSLAHNDMGGGGRGKEKEVLNLFGKMLIHLISAINSSAN